MVGGGEGGGGGGGGAIDGKMKEMETNNSTTFSSRLKKTKNRGLAGHDASDDRRHKMATPGAP